MTKEALKGKEANDYKAKDEGANLEVQKDNVQCEAMKRFRKQQVTNLQIKEVMAQELEAMDLAADAIDQILHIEDETPL